jgi:phytoene synthase
VGGLTPMFAAGRREGSSRSSSFHYSFTLLPRDQRRAIEAVYAFSRVIDDVTDEDTHLRGRGGGSPRAAPDGPAGAAPALALYREEIARCYEGLPALPVTRALQAEIRRFDLPRRPFEDLLDGVEMDLTKRRYADFDELRLYCMRVASAVGILCLGIFRCRENGSRDYAIELGIALQLTNILRDLKADAARGRIYLPLDEIDRFGYSEPELLAGVRNAAFVDLMRHQVERADRHFALAARALPERERPRLLAAEVMGAIYRRLLRRIEADGFRVFERRITVPRTTQIALALRAWATGRVDAR